MKKFLILICTAALLCLNACNEDSNSQTTTPPQGGQTNPPATTCEDTCDGVDVCEGTDSYKTCKDNDGDGCKEWVTLQCEENTKCDKGKCISEAPGCQDTCEGEDYCDGTDAYKTCKDSNGDECKEWVTIPCAENTKCENGTCAPACSDTCEGAPECDGESAVKTCKDNDGDGCNEWVSTPCEANKKCDNGACTDHCTSDCDKGQKKCNEKTVQICDDYNGDGCFEWGGDSPCEYKCNEGSCVEDPNAWVPACSGDDCPTVVTDFSKIIAGNTQGGSTKFSTYSCDSSKSEAGPENSYVFKVDEPGTVIVGVTEPSGGDVDVHILSALDANSCLDRGDKGANAHIDAGIYYVVVDTFGSSDNAGSYKLKITFLPDSGKCGLVQTKITHEKVGEMHLPITGKVVKEAHMVTPEDYAELGNRWPNTIHEYVSEHRKRSAAWTGINDGEEWCPRESCEFGQGSTGDPVPWKAEAWYVCMYWTYKTKPKPGTRFLVVNPQTGETVVTAAGYETGPADEGTIGGAVYEIHYTLGTDHESTLTFGQMNDQSLEYGPINCNE